MDAITDCSNGCNYRFNNGCNYRLYNNWWSLDGSIAQNLSGETEKIEFLNFGRTGVF